MTITRIPSLHSADDELEIDLDWVAEVGNNSIYLRIGDFVPGSATNGRRTWVDANELRDAIDKAVGKRTSPGPAVEREAVDWRNDDRVEVTWDGERIVLGRETVGDYAGEWVSPSGFHYTDEAIAGRFPKAVGKREADKLFSDQASIYHQVAVHPVFDDCWTPDSTPSAAAMLKKLDDLSGSNGVLTTTRTAANSWYRIKNHDFFDDCWPIAAGDTDEAILKKLDRLVEAGRAGVEASKPYRPVDRDRLLRHIEDVEASLTRRNERWEKDQARIRELEMAVGRAKNEAEVREAQLLALTPRELLERAWKNATVPEGDIIPEGTPTISHHTPDYFMADPKGADYDLPARGDWGERRLLDPRVEPTAAEKRQSLIDEHGLEDWEIEILRGSES